MSGFILHDYQKEAVKAVFRALGDGQMAALIVQPTGTGKTVVFSEIIRQWQGATLVLAHREELLTQAREKLLRGWPEADIGLIGAGHDEPGHLVTVGSVQSLSRKKRLAWLQEQNIELVIVDEAHHATAATYQKIIEALRAGQPDGSAFLLGVTATPKRSDKKSIRPIFGEPVFSAGLAEMIHRGYLCPPKGIQVKTTVRLDDVRTRMGDFMEGELQAAVNRQDRNEVIVSSYLEYAPDRQAIAFTAGVRHAHDLAACFRASGVDAEALDGGTPTEDRHRLLDAYGEGALRVICNCGVLTEGFDAPKTSCIILARPTESQSLYLQMIGRGTRLAKGKEDCLILDIADMCSKHSLVMLPDVYTPPAPPTEDTAEEDEAGDTPERHGKEELPPNGRIIAKEIILLPGAWTWLNDRTAYWRTPGVQGEMRIVAREVDGRAYWRPVYAPSTAAISLEYPLLPDADLRLTSEIAMAFCEHKAQKILDGFYKPGAFWRTQPASDKQIMALERMRYPFDPTITKGEASDWLDWLFFLRGKGRKSA